MAGRASSRLIISSLSDTPKGRLKARQNVTNQDDNDRQWHECHTECAKFKTVFKFETRDRLLTAVLKSLTSLLACFAAYAAYRSAEYAV
jgi:hypothetical protein